MQHFSIKFEAKDFEFERWGYIPRIDDPKYPDWCRRWGDYYHNDPQGHFKGFAEIRANNYTHTVNRRLLLFSNGRKNPNILKWAIMIFGYLWVMGTPQGGDRSFKWVALTEISKKFLQYHRVGRPKTQTNTSQHYIINEENPIPRSTTLTGILKDLKTVELIESKKSERNEVYYRISSSAADDKITVEEKYSEAEKRLYISNEDAFEARMRFGAAIQIMEDLKIKNPEKKVEEFLKKEGYDFAYPELCDD